MSRSWVFVKPTFDRQNWSIEAMRHKTDGGRTETNFSVPRSEAILRRTHKQTKTTCDNEHHLDTLPQQARNHSRNPQTISQLYKQTNIFITMSSGKANKDDHQPSAVEQPPSSGCNKVAEHQDEVALAQLVCLWRASDDSSLD